MDQTMLIVITILGSIMAVIGIVGLVYYIARFRRVRRRFEQGESEDSDAPANTFASIWVVNGFLHIGMLLLVLGGAGLIFYGTR